MAEDPYMLLKAAEDAAKSAKRAVMLTLVAVAVAVVVLAIDHGIKRAIITEAQRARGILDEFKGIAGQVMDGGTQAAGQDRAVPGGTVDAGDGVVHDPGASAAPAADADGGRAPAIRRAGRAPGGPRRNG